MLTDDALQVLADSIRENGLRDPIVLYGGRILDGRNRYAACRLAGVKPRFEEFHGTPLDALAFCWDVNFRRRHLNSSQAAVAEARRATLDEEYAGEVNQAKQKAARRSTQAKGKARGKKQESPVSPGNNSHSDGGPVREQRARAAGTNPRYVSDADHIVKQRPDLAQKIQDGKLTIPQAKREIQREQKRKDLAQKARVAKAASKNGDAPGWEIICGDLLEELGKLKPGSVRLIFCDPPYNNGTNYGRGPQADQRPSAEYIGWCREWIKACTGLLTPDGSLWLMIDDRWAAQMAMLLHEARLHRRAWIKWYETFGVNQANNFNRCSRHIFYAVRDPKRFVFNARAVSRPSDRQAKYGDKRADPGGKIWDDVWAIPRLVGTAAERIPDFPTQVPLAITRAIVGCASDPGDLVLDPFSGSASTGVAAIELDRQFIGIDRETRFCTLAKQRLAGVTTEEAPSTLKLHVGE